jgi:hypothetical protein
MKPVQTSIWLALITLAFFVGNLPVTAQILTFTTNTYAVGGEPFCVVAADVNGDGKLGLISANFGDGTLTVLTNNGSGIFGFNATLKAVNVVRGQPQMPGPSCVAAADVNGDGKLDLVSANFQNDTLTVFTNNGRGGFALSATLALGMGRPPYPPVAPACVAAADINGDGSLDLISANNAASTLSVWTNNGSGIFSSNATLNLSSGPIPLLGGNQPLLGGNANPWCIVAADVNGDGIPDLICANAGGNSLTVFINNGSGGFGTGATYQVGSEPSCVMAADINGDGYLDLICANAGGNSLTVLTNNGSGGFGFGTPLNVVNVGNRPDSVAAADMNGDGYLDLICANSNDNTLMILTNNGSGNFGSNTTVNVGSHPSSVVAADINGDGKMDLICANYVDGTLTVLTQVNVGPPTLSVSPTETNTIVLSWSSFSTGFSVQTNSDLTTTNWAPAGYPVSISNGTNQSVTIIPPPEGNLFFRLKQ